jgi:hypothetical protein
MAAPKAAGCFFGGTFRGEPKPAGRLPGSVANVFLLSRPTRGKELEAQLPNAESRGKDARGRKSENWKAQITSTFEEAADDLNGTTERDILDEIKRYRAQRKKSPEISVITLPQEKTA